MRTWGLNEWGDIANIVIAVASVATAIVTAIVLCKQYRLQRKQNEDNRLEHQPIFKFDYNHKDFVSICNEGYSLSAPAKITVNSLIIIHAAEYTETKEWLPMYLTCFYFEQYRDIYLTNNYTGEIGRCNKVFSTIQKFITLKIVNLRNALQQWQEAKKLIIPGDVNKAVAKVDLIKIEYRDMYKINRTSYFWDDTEISQDWYNTLLTIANSTSSKPIDVGSTSISSMMDEVCKFKHKKM